MKLKKNPANYNTLKSCSKIQKSICEGSKWSQVAVVEGRAQVQGSLEKAGMLWISGWWKGKRTVCGREESAEMGAHLGDAELK